MIVISKKRILCVTSILCITLFVCNLLTNINNRVNLVNTVETVAQPVTNKVVVIDARTWCAR